MKRLNIKLVSFVFILTFLLPIVIQGVHDTFFHDYSHDFNHDQSKGINSPNDQICFIHDFKYFQYNLISTESLEFKFSGKIFKYPDISYHSQKDKYHNFFLLRAPPGSLL